MLLPIVQRQCDVASTIEPFAKHIDAVNIPSNPLGKLRPDALCYAHIIQESTGVEAIPHCVARHFTSLSFESHLLGAVALGVQNILCVTGDLPVEGKGGFELDSRKLLHIAQNLKTGVTTARKSIEPIDVCLCASFNANVPNVYGEFVKAREKREHGAQVFFTQAIFMPDAFQKTLREFRAQNKDVRVIAGLSFLHTKKRAFALMKHLNIPYEYIKQIEEKDEHKILLDIARTLRDYVDGFYVIPIRKYEKALTLIRQLRKLID
jgi:5,10-methylenetetrahydrofolate reductase